MLGNLRLLGSPTRICMRDELVVDIAPLEVRISTSTWALNPDTRAVRGQSDLPTSTHPDARHHDSSPRHGEVETINRYQSDFTYVLR